MQIITSAAALQTCLQPRRQSGQAIGLVPTMGALHEGHLALVRRCKDENAVAVASIYVNPTQFNNPEDLKKYPRTPEADQEMLRQAGCDVVFMPTDAEMYPAPAVMQMHFGDLETVLEGRFRPGHFNGVGIVVSKLLHMVQPGAAYFGQKDLQQCLVVRRLLLDLSFPVRLVIHPTVRETDGLAMSSRNRRLDASQRAAAPLLYQALQMAADLLAGGGTPELARKTALHHLARNPDMAVEYFEIVHAHTLVPIETGSVRPPYALCVAAHLGTVRLIDNMLLEEQPGGAT